MAGEKITIPLIRTKLQRPQIIGDHVHRSQLLERLNRRRQRPLTLVTAPAGYGKSTLVSCWLEESDLPVAWLSLDETDNDLHIFLSYLLAAVQTVSPGAGKDIQSILNSPEFPPLSNLTRILINELDQVQQAFILTLDDYHVIQNKVIHDLLTEIFKHPPHSMHLVLASRNDPPLPLTSMRGRGKMTEIRVQDLRFSCEETAEFLQKMMGKELEDRIVGLLCKKTEGWVTGLRLAALSLRHRQDLNRVLTDLPNDQRYIMDYMVTEVLSQQPPTIQQYLLKSSILNRFSAPLCQVVCKVGTDKSADEISGKDFLDRIKKANLFLVPLDDEHRWFRFHHLFQDLLKHQLERRFSPDEIDMMHRKAGTWLAEKRLIEEAVYHLLAGRDTRAAARVVTRYRHDIINLEQWHRLERLIKMLPFNSIKKNPEILLLKAWLCEFEVRLNEMRSNLNQVESIIGNTPSKNSAEWKSIRAEYDALSAFLYYLDGDGEQAVSHALQSLKNLVPQAYYVRGWAQCLLAMGYQMVGELTKAYNLVYNALQEEVPEGMTLNSRVFIVLGFVHWIAANLNGLRQAAEQSLRFGRNSNLPDTISISRYFLGITHYLRNELKAADSELSAVLGEYYEGSTLNFAHSAIALALSYQAQGQSGKARPLIKKIVDRAVDSKSSELLQLVEAFQAELALRQGKVADAKKWSENFEPHPYHPGYRFYVPHMTYAKYLLTENTPKSLKQAVDLLSELHDYYGRIHNTRYLIDVLILQAMAYDSRGDEMIALETLAEAIALAEPGRLIRPFLDAGSNMANLLNRLAMKDISLKYTGILLKAFRNEITAEAQANSSIHAPNEQASPNIGQLDPLSKRELEVMTLLAQRLNNKEIADKLFVSLDTVKKHLYNIYQKLQVKNRIKAVEKVRALGILTE